MKRDIIKIDEDRCTGCGLCIPNCPEGALQIIDGKARLVSDLACDGLGACIGHCPEDAITIEKREAEPYDERKVMETIVKAGPNVIRAHLDHLKDHGQDEYLAQAVAFLKEKGIPAPAASPTGNTHSCPGMRTMDFREARKDEDRAESPKRRGVSGARKAGVAGRADSVGETGRVGEAGDAGAMDSTEPAGARGAGSPSQLQQWPVQLHLLNPRAPYFKDADLLIAADCVPFSYADFHERFLKGKALVIFCPKLDDSNDIYVERLAEIFKHNDIKSITVLHMEVPCCFGTTQVVREALARSCKDIAVDDRTISIRGDLI